MTQSQTPADICYTIVSPLVRGLFLQATATPVIVRPLAAEDNPTTSWDWKLADLEQPEEKLAAELQQNAGEISPEVSFPVRIGIDSPKGKLELLVEPTGGATATPEIAAADHRGKVVAGKIAVVTGGAQGFGAEIVRGLVGSGAYVFVADLNLDGATAFSEELNGEGLPGKAVPVGVNVTDEESVAAMFTQIAATAGGLDLVVSNAGVLRASSILTQDAKSFDFVTAVNYTAFMLVVKHAGLLLRRQSYTAGGWLTDIVQVNSKSGLEGSNKNGSYAGSKFGSLGLVQSFALELVEYGIKVNAICPGNFFDGPLWSDPDNGLFVQYLRSGKVPGAQTIADVKAAYEAKVPMNRGANGIDVMRALYYLVEQAYETGQALPVTGGQVMLSS